MNKYWICLIPVRTFFSVFYHPFVSGGSQLHLDADFFFSCSTPNLSPLHIQMQLPNNTTSEATHSYGGDGATLTPLWNKSDSAETSSVCSERGKSLFAALFWINASIKRTSECNTRHWAEHIEPLSWCVHLRAAPQKHPCLNPALSSQKYCLLYGRKGSLSPRL